MDFFAKLDAAVTTNNSLLCIGLDPNIEMLPEHLRADDSAYLKFNKGIIDATADLVSAYKPNSAFYEARGAAGIEELKQTCEYIHQKYPAIPIILDCKRGDIGSTNDQYATFAFDYIGADAITIQPYMGREAVQPFLDRSDKGIIILLRTSNAGSGELQDLDVGGKKLFLRLLDNIQSSWNKNDNCAVVVGATMPDELAEVRAVAGDDLTFLVPGVGAQGGDVEATVKGGINSAGRGIIINSARDIIYASSGQDFAEAARTRAAQVRDEINIYRSK